MLFIIINSGQYCAGCGRCRVSALTHVMKCDHHETSRRLVSWAEYCRGKHAQGFRWVECCARCGKQITPRRKKQ